MKDQFKKQQKFKVPQERLPLINYLTIEGKVCFSFNRGNVNFDYSTFGGDVHFYKFTNGVTCQLFEVNFIVYIY